MTTSTIRGDLLRELRRERNLTLRQVSAKAYIALGYLSEVEVGTKQPSDDMLESVVNALGLNISEFYLLMSLRLGGESWSTSLPKHYALVSQ